MLYRCIQLSVAIFKLEETKAHRIRDKEKLLKRVGRIRSQIDAVERALDKEWDCSSILQTIAAYQRHMRYRVLDPDWQPTSEQAKAAQELIDVVKTYLKYA